MAGILHSSDSVVDGKRGRPGILRQPQSRTTCIFTGRHDRDDWSGRYVWRTLCSRKKHLSDAVSGIPLQIFHQLPGSDALRAACIPDETDLTFRDRFDQTDGKHFTAQSVRRRALPGRSRCRDCARPWAESDRSWRLPCPVKIQDDDLENTGNTILSCRFRLRER